MNIDEMQAGPELDSLVAERVIGWKRHNWAEHGALVNTVYCTECGAAENKGAEKRASVFCYHFDSDIPSCSVDIAAAWAAWQSIIDRMWRKMEFMWRFFPESEAGGGVRIMCYIGESAAFYELCSETASWNVEAETAPLAICRAALKAVGVDKSDQSVV